ncbi:MAG: iron ABC transporter permease [Pseudomonadota bacterium]
MKPTYWILVGLAFLILLGLIAIAVGSVQLGIPMVLTAIGNAVTGAADAQGATPMDRIVIDLRLPRAILAVLAGAGLGVVGCLLQTVTRNDLADPFLFGLSSGAAAGAVFVITVTGDVLGFWTLPLAAFIGGMTASIIVLVLVVKLLSEGPARLILAGLAVSFLFMALTNYMVFAGDQRAAHSVLFWTLGGLGLARWNLLPIALAGFLVVFLFAMFRHRQFDSFLAGDETAITLGVDVERMRRATFLVCAFSTAAFVSITGVIGFVGLMVPHLARSLTGPLHANLVVLSAILGAAILLASDIVARTILSPQELPIGIVTTSIGALFVLGLVRRL